MNHLYCVYLLEYLALAWALHLMTIANLWLSTARGGL